MQKNIDVKQTLAENLKKLRLERGFTQDFLAEKADVITQTISNIERNYVWPTDETLNKIALALEIQPEILFRETEREFSEKKLVEWNECKKKFHAMVDELLENLKPELLTM